MSIQALNRGFHTTESGHGGSNRDSIFLATTAIRDFWGEAGKPILFLGEWCLRYDQRDNWKDLVSDVLEYPWNDRAILLRAIDYCNNLYESALDCLVQYMNTIHNVKFSERYWRIILGPWLHQYICALYDRYTCLKLAFEKFTEFETIVLDEKCFITPFDFLDFFHLFIDDPYNLQLFSEILKGMGYSFDSKQYPIRASTGTRRDIKRTTKKLVKTASSYYLSVLRPNNSIVLYDMHFKQSDLWRICLRTNFKIWPMTKDRGYPDEIRALRVRDDLRRGLGDFLIANGDDFFGKILFETFAVNIPRCYIEGYQWLRDYNRDKESLPLGLVSSFGWKSNEHFKFSAAEAAESGTTLFGMQHGGASGINKYSPGEHHIIQVSDAFFTWGWSDGNPKISILPDPGIQRLKKIGESSRTIRDDMPALFVGTIFYRYLHYFRFSPLGPQVKEYLLWQIRFLKALTESVRTHFIVRLSPRDFGWANRARITDQLTGLKFDDFSLPYRKQIQKCKLIVVDNCQTTFFEAIVLNRPLILFFDPAFWDVSEEAEPYLENLQKAGILYYNPESAAQKVTEVFNAPGTWWYSDTVQAARKEFVDYFAVSAENWLDLWEKELLSCSVCGKQDKE